MSHRSTPNDTHNSLPIKYSSALFKNMAHSVDVIWAVDVPTLTVYVIHDTLTPERTGTTLSHSEAETCIRHTVLPEYLDAVLATISPAHLENLKQDEETVCKVFTKQGEIHTLRQVMTPEFDEQGNTATIYVSCIIHRQAEVQANLERYMSAVSCGIIQYTKETKTLLYANDIALEMLGCSSMEEMQNEFNGAVSTVNAEDAEELNRLVASLQAEGDSVQYEYRVKQKNGNERICYGISRLLPDVHGEPVIQRSLIDVTEGRKVFRRLEATQGTPAGTHMGMWSVLLGEGSPKLYMTDIMADLAGTDKDISPEEANRILLSRVDTADREKFSEFAQKLLSDEMAEIEFTYHHPQFGPLYIRCGGVQDKNYSGKGTLVRGYHQNITKLYAQKRRLEDAIQINRALSRDYVNIYVINPDLQNILVMKQDGFAVEDKKNGTLLTISYVEGFRRYIEACVHPEDREGVRNAVQLDRVVATLNKRTEYVHNYRTVNKGLRHFQCRFLKLEDGRIIMGVKNIDKEVSQEVAQRKLVENALAAADRASKAKTVFLNNMSHDIRTPMNAIIGFTGLASRHLDDMGRVADYLEKIQTSGNHLLSLINDVLDMSRIESAKVKIEESEVSLIEVMNEIQSIIQADVRKKSQKFYLDTGAVKDDFVWCDRLRLNQVLLNCISNAVKYTPARGTIRLVLRQLHYGTEGHASYEFRIRDNGIGMDSEFVTQVFEPFSRENTSTISGIEGTGLGMTITKSIVDMMGGSISVASEKDKGTEFTIIITFRLADKAIRSAKNENTAETNIDLDGLSILLVEDNEMNREIAEEILSEVGAKMDTAENGQIAVEKVLNAEAGTYDLVLMDIQMPVMNGFEATRSIRTCGDREKACVPIIAMTANAFEEDKNAALEAGMNAHIAKPVDTEKLIATIRHIVKKQPEA